MWKSAGYYENQFGCRCGNGTHVVLSCSTNGTILNLIWGREGQNWAYEEIKNYSCHGKGCLVRICVKGGKKLCINRRNVGNRNEENLLLNRTWDNLVGVVTGLLSALLS
jgi:hypothetical protein